MPLSRTPILITGGAGFIGSCFPHRAVATGAWVVVLDLFTYAVPAHPSPSCRAQWR
jgi:nucleoside-diphosphate-sugar epimerase